MKKNKLNQTEIAVIHGCKEMKMECEAITKSKLTPLSPIKMIMLGLILGYIILVIAYWPQSCTTKKSRSMPYITEKIRLLSDDEKIKIAVAEVIKSYPSKDPIGSYSLPKSKFKYGGSAPLKDPVAYRDMDEFFAINPSCCQIVQSYKIISQSAELNGIVDRISFWDRLDGTTTIVVVQYLLRYRDEHGAIQSYLKETYSVMGDCGEDKGGEFGPWYRDPKGRIFIYPILDIIFNKIF